MKRNKESIKDKKMKILTPIKKNKFGVANWLTVTRLLLMIPFIAIMSIAFTLIQKGNSFSYQGIKLIGKGSLWLSILYWINISIFIVAMVTDFVDGYYARKHKTESTFGKIFDPIADKVATTLMIMFLAIYGFTYLPILMLFIVRDILVDGSRVYAIRKNTTVAANVWGKVKTIVVSLAIIALSFSAPWLINATKKVDGKVVNDPIKLFYVNLPLIIGLLLAWISGIIYMIKYLKGIKNELVQKEDDVTKLFSSMKASPTIEINIDENIDEKKSTDNENNIDQTNEQKNINHSDQIDFSKTEIFE